jgi:hypothetical protein
MLLVSECLEVSQRQAFRVAFLVFRGTVIRVQDLAGEPLSDVRTGERQPALSGRDGAILVTFAVNRGWKGPVTPRIQVVVVERPTTGASYRFQYGREYVVYAIDHINQDWAALRRLSGGAVVYGLDPCTARVRTDVAEESRRLGRGHRVQEPGRAPESPAAAPLPIESQ